MNSRFALDKTNSKLLGVCAGLANWTGMDATAVRLIAVLLVLVTGPLVLLGYIAAALAANKA